MNKHATSPCERIYNLWSLLGYTISCDMVYIFTYGLLFKGPLTSMLAGLQGPPTTKFGLLGWFMMINKHQRLVTIQYAKEAIRDAATLTDWLVPKICPTAIGHILLQMKAPSYIEATECANHYLYK